MLKRYFFGAFLALLLLLGLCFANSAYIDQIMGKAIEYADQALDIAQAEDLEQACACALRLHTYWQEHRNYLESMMLHEEVDKITETLSNFVSAGLTGDMEDFVRTKILLCEQFTHLVEMEKLRFHNVF